MVRSIVINFQTATQDEPDSDHHQTPESSLDRRTAIQASPDVSLTRVSPVIK
jgi:hypothetical protein